MPSSPISLSVAAIILSRGEACFFLLEVPCRTSYQPERRGKPVFLLEVPCRTIVRLFRTYVLL
ncbi:uncharacterized protein METZ01_LOCUS117508, partial [marine metagenome]